MNDICERLRKEIAWEQDIGELLEEASAEIARLRLTDEEREAVAYYLGSGGPHAVHATLSGLLARLSPPAT